MKVFLKTSLTVFTILLSIHLSFAQDQLQLAVSYYNQKEFEKAAPLFKKLYQQRQAKYYFDYYLRCLINLNQYSKAEKYIKREIRRHPDNPSYLVDLAFIYEKEGKKQEASKIYKKLLSNIPSNRYKIIETGNSLINYRKLDIAEKLYIKAAKKTGYPFYNQLYTIYAIERNNEKLITVLLNQLKENPTQLSNIENRLLPFVQNDVNNEFTDQLEKITTQYLKKYKDISFNQLLIWLYTEKKDLSKALATAINLDKKLHGFGREIYNVGVNARDYDSLAIAEKAFEYLVEKGPRYPYYIKSKIQLLGIYYKRIQTGAISGQQQIQKVENMYISVINDLGINSQTISILTQLAHLEAFYLNNPQKAIGYIDNVFRQVPYLSPATRNQLLLEKGKILLREGKAWDAIVLFDKVSRESADKDIAFEAGLLQAKSFFFIGDREGAKLYFDKIKGMTDQEGDYQAIMYSYFINMADDSLKQVILKEFARAEFYNFRNITDSAAMYYDSVATRSYFLADRALLEKALMFRRIGDYQKAVASLNQIIRSFTYSPLLDRAYFTAAEIYRYHLNNPQKAKEYYRTILFDLRDSPYVSAARKNFRELAKE